MTRQPRTWPAGLLVLILALAGCTSGPSDDPRPEPSSAKPTVSTGLVVRTAQGPVRGRAGPGYRSFLGLPYAAPPAGTLRWRPPTPPARWTAVRDALAPGTSCPQKGLDGTSEDCLFLNVYTPTRSSSRLLPVMVWIHGGSYTSGAGTDYGPARLVTQGGVLVVTLNYRLGPLGYLALPGLGTGSGGYGLLDQQAALRWVRNNIGAFGGDAGNVTIFGESAGASSVCAQLVAPGANGLFAKAIAQSGCALPTPARDTAEQNGTGYASALGCTGAAAVTCLRAKTPEQLLAAPDPDNVLLPWAPAAGTPVLPSGPEDAFRAGTAARVPFLQGTNHDEGRFFVASQGINQLPDVAYSFAVRQLAGSSAARILAEYPASRYGGSPADAMSAIITDVGFACPALRIGRLAAAHGPAWEYEFDDPASPLPAVNGYPLRAAHGAELPYLFDVTRLGPVPAASVALGTQMVAYWTAFATTGRPDGGAVDTPGWPRLAPSSGAVQDLVPAGSHPADANAFGTAHHCTLWSSVPALPLDL